MRALRDYLPAAMPQNAIPRLRFYDTLALAASDGSAVPLS